MRAARAHRRGVSLLVGLSAVLVACGGGAAMPDAPADAPVGTDTNECVPAAHVCVTDEFGMPAVGATVTATRTGEIPNQAETGADGCASLYPDVGSWDLSARTTSNCQNPAYVLEISGCDTQEVALMATECFDG